MKRIMVVSGALAVLGAAAFLLVGRRGPTIPGVDRPLGVFPDLPPEARSVEEIMKATDDPDSLTRREAVRSLGRLEDRDKLSGSDLLPFLKKAARDVDEGVRAVGTAYLGRSRVDPEEAVPLLAELLHDPDAMVRVNAAFGLGLHRGRVPEALPVMTEAVPALLDALRDTDRDTRLRASNSLDYFPDARFRPPQDWVDMSRESAAELADRMGLRLDGDTLNRATGPSEDVAAVYVLLKAGVDANSRSSEGRLTPLHYVRRPDTARLLLAAGADPLLETATGSTPLEIVERSGSPFAEEVASLLRESAGRPQVEGVR